MPIVKIDESGRMTTPKKMGLRNTRAVIIPAGSFFVTIPLPKTTPQKAGNWLSTTKSRKELKTEAERLAREDAVKRAKRKHQFNVS
jgi:hypothetical protein